VQVPGRPRDIAVGVQPLTMCKISEIWWSHGNAEFMYRIGRGNCFEPDMFTSDEFAMFPQPQFNTRDKVQICALDAENRIVPRDEETYWMGCVRCERVSGESV
jgi:hypothetical protein